MKISICIPTFNRAAHLTNCLNSILVNKQNTTIDFEVCISDNCSTDHTEEVVRKAQLQMPIKYQKNPSNLGIPQNFLNVVAMAEGEFAWLLGDDDLLMPNAISELAQLIEKNSDTDFFYINSFHLTTEYVFSFPQPFSVENLPKKMEPFSPWPSSQRMMFLDLINPKYSFDFLGGMFLAVFRRRLWIENTALLNKEAVKDLRTFSHFDNTFPHVKIFSHSFAKSKAYFCPKGLSVCLTGAREWSPMYPFVRSVRLIEALREYRKNGLGILRYLQCRNYALKYFIPDLVSIMIRKERSGREYVKPLKLLLGNCLFPNFYLSFFTYFIRKFKQIVSRI